MGLNPNPKSKEIVMSGEQQNEIPTSYYYLWHLSALGVIDADYGPAPLVVPPAPESALRPVPDPVICATVWDTIAAAGPLRPARIALIDVGVSRDHPNLVSRLDADASIDLTTHRYGSRVVAITDSTTTFDREERQAFFTGLDITELGSLGLSDDDRDYLDDFVAEYAASKGSVRRLHQPETLFSSHGTCCAGLMVGEPATAGSTEPLPPEVAFNAPQMPSPNPNRNLLPYFGVDPFSRLISIRTSFEDDVRQFLAAFLYAYHQHADVIVLPRGLPDPQRSRVPVKNELKADLERWKNQTAADLFTRLSVGDATEGELDPESAQAGTNPDRAWHILKRLIHGISQQIPIVCAAGNSGESQLIYPACLAGECDGIIAVGAVTPEGFRSGYSNYGDGLTVVAPSDDGEVFNRHQLRIDRLSPFAAQHNYDVYDVPEYRYSHVSLLTTDLSGSFGYDRGQIPWSSVLPFAANPGIGGGYYTSFGGTSGAAALIGGVCALIQRSAKAANGAETRLSGPQVKAILKGAASRNTPVLPGTRLLTPDSMNMDGEDALDPIYFFGAGLPDARIAVDTVLSS